MVALALPSAAAFSARLEIESKEARRESPDSNDE
jgi:hypothetical protein